MAIARAAARSMRSRKRTGWFAGATPTLSTLICRNIWIVLHTAIHLMKGDRRVRFAFLLL